MKRRLFLVLTLLAGLVQATAALGQACTTRNPGGNWATANTWNAPCNVAGGPTAANTVTLNHNVTATTAAGAVTVGAITSIATGRTLTIQGANFQVNGGTTIAAGGALAHTVSTGAKTYIGLVTVNGTFSNAGGAAIEFRGGIANASAFSTTGATTLSTANPFPISGAGAMTFAAVTVSGAINVDRTNTNTITINGLLNGNNAGSTWTNAAGTLTYNHTATAQPPMNTGALSADTAANTVNYNGTGNQFVKGPAYSTLSLGSSGIKDMTGVTTISAAMTIGGTATMTNNAGFTVGTAGVGRFSYTSTGATTLTAATPITVGQWTQSAGTINANNNTISVNGTAATTWLHTAGTFTNMGTVDFTGASPQFGGAALRFNNLRIGVSGTALLTNSTAVPMTGTVNVAAGILNLQGFTLNGDSSGKTFTVADGATLQIGTTQPFPTGYASPPTLGATSTVTYNGTTQTVLDVPAPGYGHLSLSGGAAKTMPAADLAVRGSLTIATAGTTVAPGGALTIGSDLVLTNGTFTAGSFTHQVGGNFTRTAGTMTLTNSTIEFNGTAAQAITGTFNFNDVKISNTTNPVTFVTTAPVLGDLENNGTAAGTVVFGVGTATHQLSGSGAFTNLTLNDAGQDVLITSGNPTVNGILNFTANCLLFTGSNSLILGSAATVSGPASATRHVVGYLGKTFAAAAAFTYPLGTGTALTTAVVTPSATGFSAGIVTVGGPFLGPSTGDHPDTQASSSGVDPLQSVNRYWTVKRDAAFATTFDVTFNYPAGSVTVDAGAAGMVIVRGSSCAGSGASRSCSSTWTRPTQGTVTGLTAGALGVALGTGESDFVVGESTTPRFAREKEFVFTRERY